MSTSIGTAPSHLNLLHSNYRKAAQRAAHPEEFKGIAAADAHHESAAVGGRTLLWMRMRSRYWA